MLKDALQNFVDRIHSASHMLPLFKDDSLSVKFCSEDENQCLVIFKNQIKISSDQLEHAMIIVNGRVDDLLDVLEGRVRLQLMQKRNQINVQGKYRNILRLESLLFCSSVEIAKKSV